MATEDPFRHPDYSAGFRANRSIPAHAMDLYAARIQEHLPKNLIQLRILDVGCGTGRFSAPLMHRLCCEQISYLGIDTSPVMIAEFSKELSPTTRAKIELRTCDVHKVTEKYDLILISEVIHLLDDVHETVKHCTHILRKGGLIAIRTTQLPDLIERDWYKWFPKCLSIDLARHKSQELINNSLSHEGLFVPNPFRIDESTVLDRESYIALHEQRSYSTMRLLPDAEFLENLSKMGEEISTASVVRSMMMTLTIGVKI